MDFYSLKMEADIIALSNSSKPGNDKLQSLIEEYFLADTVYDSNNRVNNSVRDGERNDSDSDDSAYSRLSHCYLFFLL